MRILPQLDLRHTLLFHIYKSLYLSENKYTHTYIQYFNIFVCVISEVLFFQTNIIIVFRGNTVLITLKLCLVRARLSDSYKI